MITTSDSKNIFNGNGSVRSFAFAWKVQNPDDLAVYHVSSTGVETLLTYNSHYLVTLNLGQDENPGGTVTFPVNGGIAALPTGEKLVVTRGDLYTQPSDVPGSTLLEESLDKLTALTQQLRNDFDRTLHIGRSDTSSLNLGTAAQRANRVLTFDTNGAVSLGVVVPDLTLTEAELLSVLTANGLGTKFYPRTASEIAAGVTPTDHSYPPGDLRRYGAAVAASAATNTTAATNAILVAPVGGKVTIAEHYTVNGDIPINNKSDLEITGGGRLILGAGAASDAYCLELIGTCARLHLHGFSIQGANNAAYSQVGIGCDSGQTISDCEFNSLTIFDINVGISHNADLGGSFTRQRTHHIMLKNILGTGVGQGYGIHSAGLTDSEIDHIIVDGSQRHAIYQAKGARVDYSDISVRNHRITVGTTSFVSAFVIARSSYITLNGYTCDNFKDCALEIAHDTANALNCEHIHVSNVTLSRRNNNIPMMFFGEQLVPGTYETREITVDNVKLVEDGTLANGDLVRILNGRRIRLSRFHYTIKDPAANAIGLTLGSNGFITDNADCEDCSAYEFTFDVISGTASNFKAFNICSDICTNTSRHELFGKFRSSAGIDTHLFDAAVTNGNLLTEETMSGTLVFNPANAADGAGETSTDIAVPAAALGDYVEVSFSEDLQGILLTGFVRTAGQVRARFQNETGGAIDLGTGTLRAAIRKPLA